jgi:hypothetical protein
MKTIKTTPIVYDSTDKLLRFGFSSRVTDDLDATELEDRLLRTLRQLDIDIAQIQATYRPEIATGKISERAKAALGEGEKLRGRVNVMGSRWATMFGSLERKAGLAPSTDPATTTRELWVLDQFRRMDPHERLTAIRLAVEAGDALTVRSVLTAPRAFAVLTPEFAQQVRDLWCQQRIPEQVAACETLKDVFDTCEHNYASVVDAVKKIGGIDDMRSRLEAQQGQSA